MKAVVVLEFDFPQLLTEVEMDHLGRALSHFYPAPEHAYIAVDDSAEAVLDVVAPPDPTELECPSHPGKFGDH